MANYTSSRDIINAALGFAGELTNPPDSDYVSEYRSVALQYLNRIHQGVISGSNEFELDMGEPFSWAVSQYPKIITIEPKVEQNISITQNSATGTFLSPPTDSYKNKFLRVGGSSQEYYQVLDHDAGSPTFTLDSEMLEDTNSNANGNFYTLEYSLGTDVLRLIARGQMDQVQYQTMDGTVLGTDLNEMLRIYPMVRLQTAFPNRYALVNWNTDTGEMHIRINTTPNKRARLKIPYVPTQPALTDDATSIPVVPLQFRIILAYAVAFYLCQDKNDTRAQSYYTLTQTGLQSIISADKRQSTDINPDRARVIPRMGMMGRNIWPWKWWGGGN